MWKYQLLQPSHEVYILDALWIFDDAGPGRWKPTATEQTEVLQPGSSALPIGD